ERAGSASGGASRARSGMNTPDLASPGWRGGASSALAMYHEAGPSSMRGHDGPAAGSGRTVGFMPEPHNLQEEPRGGAHNLRHEERTGPRTPVKV
ncbi:hypothetical protein T484DRAFT_1766162, partial [Baffinella frigidus]